jgi:hypothetical protein
VPIVSPSNRVLHVGGGLLGTQGSLGGEPVPFSHEYFHVTNLWGAKRHGIYVDVYAGAPAATPGRGGLLVDWTDPNVGLPMKKSGIYTAPRDAGPLTLTNVRGNEVFFAFVGGRGSFDLRTRRFAIGR